MGGSYRVHGSSGLRFSYAWIGLGGFGSAKKNPLPTETDRPGISIFVDVGVKGVRGDEEDDDRNLEQRDVQESSFNLWKT